MRLVDGGTPMFVLSIFAFSIGLAFLSDDARFALAKESVFTLIAGLYCVGLLFVGRPLTYYTGRQFAVGNDPAAKVRWEQLWKRSPGFRHAMRTMTIVWGLGLIIEALLRLALVYSLPVSAVVVVSPLLAIAVFGGLIIFSIVYGRHARKPGEGKQAEGFEEVL